MFDRRADSRTRGRATTQARVLRRCVQRARGLAGRALSLAALSSAAALFGPPRVRAHDAKSVKLEATYTGDGFADMAGGEQRGWTHLGTVQLTLSADLHELIGWRGARLFLHTLTAFGGQPSAFAGDVQVLDNLAAPAIPLELYEAWLEQDLFEHRLSALAGLYDLNSEFDTSYPGSVFINSAQGIGSAFALSTRNGPSIFPLTDLGARIKFVPAAPIYQQLAVMEGVVRSPGGPGPSPFFSRSGGSLVVLEAGGFIGLSRPQSHQPAARRRYILRNTPAEYRFKLAAGAWVSTMRFPNLVASGGSAQPARLPAVDHGLYGLVDALVLEQPGGKRQGLWAFGRVGSASPRVDAYPLFVGGGLVYRGPWPKRDRDELGLAVAVAFAGETFQRARRRLGRPSAAAEADVELTYLAQVASWLTLQADVQYIIDPSAEPSIPNALVMLTRYQIAF